MVGGRLFGEEGREKVMTGISFLLMELWHLSSPSRPQQGGQEHCHLRLLIDSSLRSFLVTCEEFFLRSISCVFDGGAVGLAVLRDEEFVTWVF